jgi:septin 3/9/12
MATAEVQEIRATSYVGFDSITQQIEHKLLKRGFQFNVIVVGLSSQCLPTSYT